jgi:pyruvate dehydrogenase E2 component (dihydrolipoamide acetyltransferase)
MSEFVMPSLGADMESGILIEWLVKPGDRVHRGDIVAVVETDKGAIEIEIFEDAIVAELLVALDTEVAVGTPLARLDKVGQQPAVAAPPTAAATRTPPVQPPKVATPVQATPVQRTPLQPAKPAAQQPAVPRAVPVSVPAPAQPAAAVRRKISPAARKHAREYGIDLDRVVGTGDGGVVTVADVEQLHGIGSSSPAATPTPVPPRAAAPPGAAPQSSAMRRAIAASMSRSKREIPHYYLAHTIDLEPALRWLESRNVARPIEQRLVYGAVLLKAVARAATDVPTLNGYWRDGAFVGSDTVDVGVVISLRGGGLAAPALHDVAAMDIDTLMAALKDATERARRGRLKSSELTSATITVSSLGDAGVEAVYAVIHPPQVAIVGFGAVVTRPWVIDGGLHVRRVITATLAADHRASDGHEGARFLAALAGHLANPEAL